MIRPLLLSSAILTLSSCAATDVYNAAATLKNAKTAVDIAQGVRQTVKPSEAPTVSAEQKASLTNAAPIDVAPLSVDMRKTSGSTRIFKEHPKIAIAGYNVGAFISGKAKSSSGGSLLGSGQGASATVELNATGIDEVMIQRIATAAYQDLVAQMQAAGISIVAAPQVAAAQNSGGMKFEAGSYEKKFGSGASNQKRVKVAGPDDVGYRGYFGIGKKTFGSSASNKLSMELDAVILSPNLVLDFVALKSKRRMFGNKANASGNVQFSIDPSSIMNIHSSKGKGGAWLVYGIKKPIVAAGDFAVVSKGDSRTNALEQGLGAALGMGTRAKKTTTYTVAVDPARYEALALKAAKGWNTAFVAQVKSSLNK